MAQSGNPGGGLRHVSDIPTEKCEGSRGLRSDGVGLRMTETEKYKLGFSPWNPRHQTRLLVTNDTNKKSVYICTYTSTKTRIFLLREKRGSSCILMWVCWRPWNGAKECLEGRCKRTPPFSLKRFCCFSSFLFVSLSQLVITPVWNKYYNTAIFYLYLK